MYQPGANLLHHPHLHCVGPGGGVSLDGQRWINCRPGFFLSVRTPSRLFRRLFLTRLRDAFDRHEVHFFNARAALQDADALATIGNANEGDSNDDSIWANLDR